MIDKWERKKCQQPKYTSGSFWVDATEELVDKARSAGGEFYVKTIRRNY